MRKSFFDTYEKVFPREKKQEVTPQNITAVSAQDMKDYFEAIHEQLINDLKKEMVDYINTQQTKTESTETPEENKGGQDDASNSIV